ncbi:hypothetical protein [Flammeovirga sp. SJP92]|uniref:hypothetical protein n=1 Tax=Flammeovirga sp. SJP92 TaxID=1775430 RepID=UPI00078705ED|nr:hypothetical protein [Flammeovirga sp. SJP92]KXX67257.1 hypothetical protein AVL50_28125 [Flammeovirga sp. SJP92]
MDIQELIFSVIGLVVYWYLSNLGKKKNDKNKNKNINQETIIPPTNQGEINQSEGDHIQNREEVKAPTSFTDLLNILSDPGKIESRQRDINPLDPQKSEERLVRDLDQYSPSNVAEETYESEMDRYYDDQDDYQWQDDFTNDDLDKEKVEKGKTIAKKRRPKKKKNVAQLFKNPNRIRDAYIMNEILMKRED